MSPGGAVPNQTNFAADAGVGFYWNLWRSAGGTRAFALRPEIKVRWENPGHTPDLQDYIADLGFQYSFGGSRAASAPAAAAAASPQARSDAGCTAGTAAAGSAAEPAAQHVHGAHARLGDPKRGDVRV